MCVLPIALLIGFYTMSKDVLEVYQDYFIVKSKDRRDDLKIYLKYVTLKYEYLYGDPNSVEKYCLKRNNQLIQIFDNSFKNIRKLCDFCIENYVKAIPPATWLE